MITEVLSPRLLQANLQNHEDVYNNFDWEDVEKEFTWHSTGKVNMAFEAVDRHALGWRKNKIALYYEDDLREEKYTFQELMLLSNKFGNVLRKLGIKKGDRVFVFMPRSPELYIAFLGIAKVGAVVGPLFEAFMEDAVRDRLKNSDAIAVVTTPFMMNRIPRKDLPSLKHIIVVGAEGEPDHGDISYEREMAEASDTMGIEWLSREDPLILHYTSGSTGKPKGVLHIHNAMIGHYLTAN